MTKEKIFHESLTPSKSLIPTSVVVSKQAFGWGFFI